MNQKHKPALHLSLRLVIGGILLYAGLLKALEPGLGFAGSLMGSHLLPKAFALNVGFFLPWIELVVGLYLVTGFLSRLSAGVAAGLFALYSAVLGIALYRGIALGHCMCFGVNLAMTPPQALVLDLVLFLASVQLIYVYPTASPLSLDRWIER